MIQFNVRERLQAVRRSLGALRGQGALRAPSPSLVLDDGPSPGQAQASVRAPLPDSPGRAPTAAERAAVLALADRIRAESDILLRLTARARDRAEALARGRAGVCDDWPAQLREVEVLAVDAALAAVRAGASTRGFSAAAEGLAPLADGVRMAWSTVEPDLVRVEEGAADVAYVAARLRRLGQEIADECERTGSALAPDLEREAVACARELADLCEGLGEQVDRLARDVVVLVRQSPVGNRRSDPRVPFDLGCRLVTATGAYWGRTRDLSRTGAMVALRPMPDLHRAQPVTLLLDEIGALTGTIVGVSTGGAHISFDLAQAANAATRPALLAALADVEDGNEAVTERCRALAADLTETMEAGLANFAVTLDDLLSEPTGGAGEARAAASPAQAFYAAFLPAVLARHLDRAAGDAAASVVDRHGLVPVSVTPGHGAGRDPHRGRITADPVLLKAARSVAPCLVQLRPAEPGQGGTLRCVSVPLFVRGRHWGCAAILTEAAERVHAPVG